MPIVVGRDAAHTPSLFSVLSSMLDATTKGGAHYSKKNGTKLLYDVEYSGILILMKSLGSG